MELSLIASNVWQYSQALLTDFIKDPEFDYKIALAFEQPQISQSVRQIIQGWINDDVIHFPRIEVLPSVVLKVASGAYANANKTAYISSDFLSQNAGNLPLLSSILIEELGHYLDVELNSVDTPGDEGELFSALVRNQEFDPDLVKQIKLENDFSTVFIDNQLLHVEQSVRRSTYNINIEGYTQGNYFNRSGQLYINSTIAAAGTQNGINPVDVFIGSGNPAATPTTGAIWLGTNNAFIGSSSQIDLAYV